MLTKPRRRRVFVQACTWYVISVVYPPKSDGVIDIFFNTREDVGQVLGNISVDAYLELAPWLTKVAQEIAPNFFLPTRVISHAHGTLPAG